MTRKVFSWVIMGVMLLGGILCSSGQAVPKSNPVVLQEIMDLLEKTGSEPVVLKGNDPNKLVVVTPKLMGRVMCCSFDGMPGKTNAFINEKQIRDGFSTKGYAARADDGWNSFGGEERIWFAPEGGKWALFFEPGTEQNWDNYRMPFAMNSAQYQVVRKSEDDKAITFQSLLDIPNYQGFHFKVNVVRQVTVLESSPFSVGLGDRIENVGFETETFATNVGDKQWKKESEPFAIWTLGIFNSTPNTVVLFPYKEGPDSELGPPVTTEYFRYFCDNGKMDDNYWAVKPGCALLKANSKVQTKLEMLRKRCLGRIASVDVETGEMTIVEFGLYPELPYTASFFLPFEGDPLDGGAMSSFVLKGEIGSAAKPAFYELEVCSPNLELNPGETFRHVSRTYHLRGDKKAIEEVCKRFFNVDMKTLEAFDKQAN